MRQPATAMAALLCVLPLAVLGQEGTPVSLDFAWNSVDLSSLAMADGREAYALETSVTVDPATGGPLAGLQGRCILSGVREPGASRHEGTGTCVFTDRNGDRLVQRVAEASDGPGTLVSGVGIWAGGTGRFAAAAGELRYSLVSYGLQPPGTLAGTGQAEGTLSGVAEAPAEAAPPAPRLELRPSP